ncbi:MAG: hypothetical protein KDA89_17955, partial [Planctomycetaceae bacterium]|nr:hypothetical protein [Planctomycetaceae bacterium]
MAEQPFSDESSENRHDQLLWLDELCDRFEAAWGTPKQFAIEFVLQNITANRHAAVVQALLQLETELRLNTDNPVTAAELSKRFPDYQDIIRSVLQQPRPEDSLDHQRTIPPRNLSIDTGDDDPAADAGATGVAS